MHRIIALLTIFTFAINGSASDADAIDFVKSIQVSKLEKGLPDTPYQEWINTTFKSNQVVWEVNDCGEGGDGKVIVPSCVEVQILQNNGHWLHISTVLGISGKNIITDVSLWMIYFYKSEGHKTIDVKQIQTITEAVKLFKTKLTKAAPNK